MKNFLKPRYFFLGIILGFFICCCMGYIVSSKARFVHFSRFFSYISPTLAYYPTANELLVTARHDVGRDKILVLIGGSSIFRGEGQNPDELWSDRLQNILGDQFKVLNFAFNGASLSSFGAVAYRILSEEYPKIIFVSTCSWGEEVNIDGGNTYGYLFWDAYYKKLFHAHTEEKKIINQLRKSQLRTADGIELHILSYLDSLFYFRNLWNWVGYRLIFTVWNRNVAMTAYKPRRLYLDDVADIKTQVANVNKDDATFKLNIGKLTGAFVARADVSSMSLRDDIAYSIRSAYQGIFRPRYRKNTLCVLSTFNPKYISALPVMDQKSHEIVLKDTKNIIESFGYNAIIVRDVTPEDYYDMQHFVAAGGYKIAAQVASRIKSIAINKGYN